MQSEKIGIDDLICKVEIDTQYQYMDTKGKGGLWDEVGDWDWPISPLILCIK